MPYSFRPTVTRASRYSGVQRATGNLSGKPLRVTFPGNSGKFRGVVKRNLQLQGLGCGCEGNGLGDSAQVQTTASYAAMGAKAGSVVPGIGNVVGAVVGAIAGLYLSKKKPVRPSSEQISQCQQVVNEYNSVIAQSQGMPVGSVLGEGNLKSVFICYEMVVTKTTKDPRFLDGNWQLVRDVAIEAVKKAFASPAGTEVVLTTDGRKDVNGKAFKPFTLRYMNDEANSLRSIADKVQAFEVGACSKYHSEGDCSGAWGSEYIRKAMLDLVEWAASTYLPQIQIPKEPEAIITPAAPLPAPNTPAAVAPIPAIAPVPVTPAAPSSAVVPQQPMETMTLPAAQDNSAAITALTKQMTDALLQQGASSQQAYSQVLNALAQKGVAPTAAVQATVAEAVRDTGNTDKYILYAGGALVVAGLVYFLAKKRR
jgi:hypothetical protein